MAKCMLVFPYKVRGERGGRKNIGKLGMVLIYLGFLPTSPPQHQRQKRERASEKEIPNDLPKPWHCEFALSVRIESNRVLFVVRILKSVGILATCCVT